MDGVPALVDEVRLEVLMGDGTRLVVLRNPLGAPDEPPAPDSPRPARPDRKTLTLTVTNTSDHIVRVSSHYPFDEVNPRLEFDRAAAKGYRLDLPAGSTLRWAPGETHEVTLVQYGGEAGK
jgi:urease subunit gamma/beta